MKKITLLLFLLAVITSVQGKNPGFNLSDEPAHSRVVKQDELNYSYKIIPSINNTWGYDIYTGEKKIIHQGSIPGMPGNEGFKSKSSAKKVALLVIEKLKKGEMPPSVTSEELLNLKVL
jgi:hypothetical protein